MNSQRKSLYECEATNDGLRMPLLILALFIGVPLIEIALFITVGEHIGLIWTIVIVVLTAILGTAMVQQQGLSAIQRGQAEMQKGQMPVGPMRDGFFLFGAGALLLTPGFLTDAIGFALLIPPIRSWISAWVINRVAKSANIHVETSGFGVPPQDEPARKPPPGTGPVIDGEFTEVDPAPQSETTSTDTDKKHSDQSPWRR